MPVIKKQFEVELVDINSLVQDPENARLHDDTNIGAIAGSLENFEQVEPLVVQKNTMKVIGGNGRLVAMKKLGWEKVAVHFVDMNDQKAKALALSLNRTAELAEWDKNILGAQLQALYEDGFGIADIGFDPGEWLKDIIPKEKLGSKELSEDEFSNFQNQCPKCGFEFDGK